MSTRNTLTSVEPPKRIELLTYSLRVAAARIHRGRRNGPLASGQVGGRCVRAPGAVREQFALGLALRPLRPVGTWRRRMGDGGPAWPPGKPRGRFPLPRSPRRRSVEGAQARERGGLHRRLEALGRGAHVGSGACNTGPYKYTRINDWLPRFAGLSWGQQGRPVGIGRRGSGDTSDRNQTLSESEKVGDADRCSNPSHHFLDSPARFL